MCTVSIIPNADGFRLMSNRDERRDRAVALHPRVERLGGRLVVMPIDPVGGGSWIGANDAGLVAAVLNRHDGTDVPRPLTSRGALVRAALQCDSIGAAVQSVWTLGADRFRPFRLILAHARRLAMVAGNGHQLAEAEGQLSAPRMFTASSLGDVFVDGPRRRLFECLIGTIEDPLDGQRLFHRHQWTSTREISVLMTRDDAATVSRTMVDVTERGIALEYESLIPSGAPQRVELPAC
jgi:hypothetical protein